VGQLITVTLVVTSPAAPYQGYQWDVIAGATVSFVSATSDPAVATLFPVCSKPTPVQPAGATYGGCVSLEAPNAYAGPIATITYRCDSAGQTSLILLNALGGGAFETSLIAPDASAVGVGLGEPVPVTCT
jgi:hypothetical protein